MKKGLFLFLIIFFGSFNFVSSLSLGVHIPEKYTEIVAGERFYFEVDVRYPENPSRRDLTFEYEILTDDGEAISQAKIIKAIETQASFIDFVVIPSVADSGIYIIKVNVKDYESLNEEVNTSFYVKRAVDELMVYLIIVLVVVIFVGVLVVLSIILRK